MIVLTTTLQVERHSPLGLTVTVMVVMHVVKLYTFSATYYTQYYILAVLSPKLYDREVNRSSVLLFEV